MNHQSRWQSRFPIIVLLLLALTIVPAQSAEPEPLFDGETLEGWEGNTEWWRVRDGKIVGGTNKRDIPHNSFLLTKESFQNFELVMDIRLYGKGERPNSGIQVRTARIPDSNEVEGYQVDVGDGFWGKLYDEKRRGMLIGNFEDPIKKGKEAANSTGWNKYRIRCVGPKITYWINGTKMFTYTEKDEDIPLNGKIGIQVHSGGPSVVEVRKATIKRLPPTEGAPTWPEDRLALTVNEHLAQIEQAQPLSQEQIKSAVGIGKQVEIKQPPKTPAEEKEAFILPGDFEIELVASETKDVGKFIDTTWDTAGRLWTMTGKEYPVSTGGSEPDQKVYNLFEKGGTDRVVYYPDPYGSGPHDYRTFVDGMVQPLGILPYRSGAYVQYGQDIRYYRDRDGDGKADDYETILTGFGIQDSHLFPHRFKPSPSGWIYTAQGLFNQSSVQRPGEKPFSDGRTSIPFNYTKQARFRPDGSQFEVRTWGPVNIYGHVTGRYGEGFIQESNDKAYPVMQLKPGAQYDTTPYNESRSYFQDLPKSFDKLLMGGTGLSGLALADDQGEDGWPVPWGNSNKKIRRFLIANPVANRIQRIKAEWRGTHYEFKKQTPLVLTNDQWFRPVAIHFGPDGALYIVDWYNKIISHNEVPIDHPERDKRRGRIWRVYHEDQRRDGAPDLTQVTNQELLSYLGHNHTKLSELAWREVHRRGDRSIVPHLSKIIRSSDTSEDRIVAALWALEGLKAPSEKLVLELLNHDNGNIRSEAVRVIDEHNLLSGRTVEKLHAHIDDPYHLVRGAIAVLIWRRRYEGLNPSLIRLGLELAASAASSGNRWEQYYGNYERSLIRSAIEENRSVLKNYLSDTDDSSDLTPGARSFARLVLGASGEERNIAQAVANIDRTLSKPEFELVKKQFQNEDLQGPILALMHKRVHREKILKMLANLDNSLITDELRSKVQKHLKKLLNTAPDSVSWKRVLTISKRLSLSELVPRIKKRLSSDDGESDTK